LSAVPPPSQVNSSPRRLILFNDKTEMPISAKLNNTIATKKFILK